MKRQKRKLGTTVPKPSPESIQSDSYGDDEDVEQEPLRQAKTRVSERKLSPNPIVAAVQSATRGLHIVTTSETGPIPETWLDKVFGIDLQKQLGKMILVALMDGDKKFPELVAKAIRQIDPVFNRHLEKATANCVKKYVLSLTEPLPDARSLKRQVEVNCNHGRPFLPHQWQRHAKMCKLSLPAGRPRKVRTKPTASL